MLSNSLPDLEKLINEATAPILLLVVSEACDEFKGQNQDSIETAIKMHLEKVTYYSMCIPEAQMRFPRFQAPALYYFLPKNQTPIFWRGLDALYRIPEDMDVIVRMWKERVSQEDARFTPEIKAHIEQTDTMLATEDVTQFPSKFQQARNFAKEMWTAGKKAASGQPIIAPADVAFARMETCRGCDQFEEESSRCKQCGCFMRVKSQLLTAECPLKKWDK